ncbi:hypothetical protein BHM03_00030035, partial [Ensete ventricosum]
MAEQSSWNYLGIFKISNISGKKRELVPVSNADNDVDMDSESSSDEDDDDDEDEKSSQPVLHVSNLFHVSDAVLGDYEIWDLSLEKDEEEEAEFKAKMKEQVNVPQDLPPQLLFVHQ